MLTAHLPNAKFRFDEPLQLNGLRISLLPPGLFFPSPNRHVTVRLVLEVGHLSALARFSDDAIKGCQSTALYRNGIQNTHSLADFEWFGRI